MLVIISDLHFQDTYQGFSDIIKISRNISHKAFHHFFSDIAELSKTNNATEIIFVLAGDIFDLNRSHKWFTENIRPYTSDQIEPGSLLDKVVASIWNGINTNNEKTFKIFENMATIGNNDYTLETGYEPIKFPEGIKIKFEYIPGNHDRLINLSKTLQGKVCKLLNISLPDISTFPNHLIKEEYGVSIRHGHEYDENNFAQKLDPEDLRYENKINQDSYKEATFGDVITIDLVSAVAYKFGMEYMEEINRGTRLNNTSITYRDFYEKLLEFDDVRPISKLTDWIEYGSGDSIKEVWRVFDPVFKKVIENWHSNPFINFNMQGLWLKWFIANIIAKLMGSKSAIKILTRNVGRDKSSMFAYNEIMGFSNSNKDIRYIVYGHTHDPKVDFIRAQRNIEMFSFDTGTWRKRIKLCKDEESFACAKILTYVVFYNEKDDKERKAGKYSFDVWSGHTMKM